MDIIPRPQVEVYQSFVRQPTAIELNLNAFIVGPNYQLMYHDDPSVHDALSVGDYDASSGNTVDYPQQLSESVVDTDSVRVFLEDVLARYMTISEDVTAPLVVVSNRHRNKLRAAPYIAEALEAPSGPTAAEKAANGVFLQAGGFYQKGGVLPERYYFFPQASDGVRVLNDYNSEAADDATLQYRTSGGLTGEVEIEATNNPLGAGVETVGPHGLVLDLDAIDQDDTAPARVAARLTYEAATDFAGGTLTINGTGITLNTYIGANHRETVDAVVAAVFDGSEAVSDLVDLIHVHGSDTDSGVLWIIGDAGSLTVTQADAATPPTLVAEESFNSLIPARQLTVRNAANTASFTITVQESALAALLDQAISAGVPPLRLEADPTGSAVAFDAVNNVLSIGWDNGTDTLATLRSAIIGAAGLDDVVTVSEVTGVDTELAVAIEDQFGSVLTDTSGISALLVRDVYQIQVEASPYVFSAGNGYAQSSHFKGRGVQVGDIVEYTFTGTDAQPYDGRASVIGFEADRKPSVLGTPVVNSSNAVTQAATELLPSTGGDLVAAGADNQRAFDGANTKVYGLGPSDFTYAPDLVGGYLAESFVVRITTGGDPGVARATVIGDSGYTRTGAPVMPAENGATDEAVIYVGRNLAINFHQGSGDGDFKFKAGDTYTITPGPLAAWDAHTVSDLTVSGEYTGPRDTTYVVEVIKGGYFNPSVSVAAALRTASTASISYTGIPTSGDDITIGGTAFEWDTWGGAGTATADYEALAADINASAEPVQARVVSSGTGAGTLYITGDGSVISAIALSVGYANASIDINAVDVAADITNFGELDDEYVLRCTTAGTLANAQFSIQSITGDSQTNLHFENGIAQFVGTGGLQLTLTLSGAPTFEVNDEWVVSIKAAAPIVRVTDTAGVDEQSEVEVEASTAFNLGLYGARLAIASNANGGLVSGDVFYIPATAEAAGPLTTLVLDTPLPADVIVAGLSSGVANSSPTLIGLDLHMGISSAEIEAERRWNPPAYNFEADTDELVINSGIRVQHSSWVNADQTQDYLPVVEGEVFVQYRALLQQYSDAIYNLYNIDDVVNTLGRIHPDNPLAVGVYYALLNAAGRTVYFGAVATDDLAGYAGMLAKAELSEETYSVVPMSMDPDVVDAVYSHVTAMSSPKVKHWRISFYGVDVDPVVAVYDAESNGGNDWLATLADDPATSGTQYTELVCAGASFLSDVEVGDEVRLQFSTDAWGNEVFVRDQVADVVNNETLLLATGLPTSIDVASRFEIHHRQSSAQQVEDYVARVGHYDNRRVYAIAPEDLWSDGIQYDSTAGAAAAAGLVSALPPQVPLSNRAIVGFDNIPDVYSRYTMAELDRIASAGGFILMQHANGGRVYVRHQVSSATQQGDIYFRELSITKNLDSICQQLESRLAPYYGRYNITQLLLDLVDTDMRATINYLGSDQTGSGLIGPQLLLENERSFVRTVAQHPTLKDHIVVSVDLDLPFPANVIRLDAIVGDESSINPELVG